MEGWLVLEARWGLRCILAPIRPTCAKQQLNKFAAVLNQTWIFVEYCKHTQLRGGGAGGRGTSRTSAAQQLGQKGAFSCVPPPASLMSAVFQRRFFFVFTLGIRLRLLAHQNPAEPNWLNLPSCWTETSPVQSSLVLISVWRKFEWD